MNDSKKIDDGGRAFPVPSGTFGLNGMSMRDWFAGHVIAAMAQSAGFDGAPWAKLADDAYAAADAMIAARGGRS